MKEVYVLILEQEDYSRIYGIYENYLKAEEDLNNLKRYNEMCDYGTLHIYRYDIDKLYIKDKREPVI